MCWHSIYEKSNIYLGLPWIRWGKLLILSGLAGGEGGGSDLTTSGWRQDTQGSRWHFNLILVKVLDNWVRKNLITIFPFSFLLLMRTRCVVGGGAQVWSGQVGTEQTWGADQHAKYLSLQIELFLGSTIFIGLFSFTLGLRNNSMAYFQSI